MSHTFVPFATSPYVVEPVGDRATVSRVAARAAAHWGLAVASLVTHRMNAVFTCTDGTVLRVSRPTASPACALALYRRLRSAGISVPVPARPDSFTLDRLAVWAFEPVAVAPSTRIDWESVGEMIRILHHIPSDELAAVYPLPAMHHLPLWEFGTLLRELDVDVPSEARAAMIEVAERHDHRREWTDVVACHGDVHPGNVLQTRQGPVIVDWDLMCRAPRGLDHAVLMRWPDRYGGDPDIYRQFARGYGWSALGDGVAQALGELRLLAATLLRLRATVPNGPGRDEALRRCRYWTDGARASRWTPQ